MWAHRHDHITNAFCTAAVHDRSAFIQTLLYFVPFSSQPACYSLYILFGLAPVSHYQVAKCGGTDWADADGPVTQFRRCDGAKSDVVRWLSGGWVAV